MCLQSLAQDAKHTLRLWAKHPWQTGFAVAALAIGIGANTGVFSVVNAVLLRSLPFDDASRLAALQTYLIPHDSAKQFHDWRQSSAYLSNAALFEQIDANLGDARALVRARVAQTSWNFFSLLGTKLVLGRAFNAHEDMAGRNAVAVIGYGLWQQLFAGSPRVLGANIRVNGAPLTVIGVAPPGFDYPNHSVLWKAAAYSPGNNGWETIARLKPGVTWPQARAAFKAEVERLGPNRSRRERILYPAKMLSLRDELAGQVKNASLLLLAGVMLILLIACANVAILLLARIADRSTELSIRAALGATRARLAQQILTECLLLSLLAAAAGFVVALWAQSVASKVRPAPVPTQAYSTLDFHVLGFATIVAIGSALLFGAFPSLLAGRIQALGERGATGHRSSRAFRETLVATQVMLTIVLLAASVSVGRAFVNLLRIDRGFNVQNLVTASVSLEGTTHEPTARQLSYIEDVLARLRRLPGIRSASATQFLPLYADGFVGGRFGLDGQPGEQTSMFVPVLSDYFVAMGTRLLAGRGFDEPEVRSGANVAVVNRAFAKQFGALAFVIGHRLTLRGEPPRKIIGVVNNMDYVSANANLNQVFVPAHSAGGFSLTFVARVNGTAASHLAAMRDAIRSVDPNVPVFNAKTMQQRLNDAFARPSLYRTTLVFFACFALLLAVIGIYGAVSYSLTRRMREMGVRLALGATPLGLRSMLLWQGILPVGAGAILGSVAAILTGRFLEELVEGAQSVDRVAFVFSILCIFLITSTSIWIGTRRLAGLNVSEILHS